MSHTKDEGFQRGFSGSRNSRGSQKDEGSNSENLQQQRRSNRDISNDVQVNTKLSGNPKTKKSTKSNHVLSHQLNDLEQDHKYNNSPKTLKDSSKMTVNNN